MIENGKPLTVLITGSTSGIGLEIARAFAGAGHNIIMNGLEKDGAEIAAELSSIHGITTWFDPANMLDPAALRTMVQAANEKIGPIDVLVNNAGIQHVSPVELFPDEMWEQILAINLTAAFHLTKAVWPIMKQQRFGRIINIASVHGLVASENKSAYVAAKHGLIGLTKATALEGAPFGITVNAICPGFVQTALVDKQIKDQAAARVISEQEAIETVILAKHAIKEFVDPAAIAAMCMTLVSPNAGAITGTAIPIDAGWSCQ
ncbi:MAG: 3-hydroxybutyrate dehydrogenase [Sphingobacteriales bacterium]|nr:MAG: 3-hydroxybutyrate dehydrogenase [Sphingobacteriales bacterium]